MTAARLSRVAVPAREFAGEDRSGTGRWDLGRTPTLADKVRFLKRPASYPDGPMRIEAIETHMSWVFLTDHHAYKLKKPVRYDFLDFTTLEARRRHCLAEVRLNRRLAPDVYLGVVPLSLSPEPWPDDGLTLGAGTGVVDWLVQMRRLPGERMLDRAIAEGTAGRDELRRVGERLAAFYRRARPVRISPATYRRRLARDLGANRRELLTPRFNMPPERVIALSDALAGFLRRRSDLLDARVRAGRIVEGHGDLRAEHVCLTSPPVVIDCLEFKRAFRTVDPADELAFLALDCERLGAPWIRDLLIETYGRRTGDQVPPDLVAFHGGCRALLRAKIALWHLNEPDARTPGRWRDLALRYLRLGEAWAGNLEAVRG